MGGVFGIDPAECAQETPNTQTSLFKYKDGKVLEFETRGRYTNDESSLGIRIGNIFYGTEGYLELDGDTWKAFRKREKEPFAGSEPVRKKQQLILLFWLLREEPNILLISLMQSGRGKMKHLIARLKRGIIHQHFRFLQIYPIALEGS